MQILLISNSLIIFILIIITISFAFDILNNDCDKYKSYPFWYGSSYCQYNPDVASNTKSLIIKHNYPFENHTVETVDGYFLILYRIPPKEDDNRKNKQPVFIQHGILTNSAVWVDVENQSLAFDLADNGYDVWLGNIRGSTYSKKHKNLTTSDYDYWNFNLDTIVKNDIGAELKYIESKTNKPGSIIYIGHSMGTTLSFMYASEFDQEASSLLKGIIALAPVAYFENIATIKTFASLTPVIKQTFDKFGINALFQNESNIKLKLASFCTFFPCSCKKMIEVLFGKLTDQFKPNYLLLYCSYWPTSTSLGVLSQYGQIGGSGNFAKFNYGREDNLKIYGTVDSPKYNLSKIKLPVYLFYGKNDAIVTEENVEKLFNELGSQEKQKHLIPLNNNDSQAFNHLNFEYAKDSRDLLHQPLLKAMSELAIN